MIYTINIKPHFKPYLLALLVILFSFLFYYLLNYFLLRQINYKQVVNLLNNSSETRVFSVDLTNTLYARKFSRLKKSNNAGDHFIIAEYFDRFNRIYLGTIGRETPVAVGNKVSNSLANVQVQYEKGALNHFQRAIRLNPLSSKYHISFAECLDFIYKKRFHNDIHNTLINNVISQHFESATKLDNKWDHPFRAYGNWLFSLANSEEISNRNDLLKQTLDLAVFMYKEAITRNNSLFLEGIRKYNAFTNNYHELKKIVPDVSQLYYSFAKYLQEKGLWEINESNFYNDIQLHTERFPFYKALVEYLSQKKRFIEGVYLLKEYLKYSPEDVYAHLWLSNLLFYDIKNKEEAIKEIEIALKLNPEDLNVLFSYGKMLFSYEEHEKSIEILRRVLSKDTKRHEAYFLIAQSYEKSLEMSKAEESYENAISLNPNSIEYKGHIARLRINLKTKQQ